MVDDVVRTVLVTALLTVGVVGAFAAAGRVSPDVRVTAYAGFWAGAFLLGMLTISFGSFRAPLEDGLVRVPSPVAAVLGGVAGVLVVGLLGILWGSRAVGIVFIAQTVIAGAGLILFFQVGDAARGRIALLTLGAAVGVCLTFLVPRRFVSGYERSRSVRAAARRGAQDVHRRFRTDRQLAPTLRLLVRSYRRARRRQWLDTVRHRFRWPGAPR